MDIGQAAVEYNEELDRLADAMVELGALADREVVGIMLAVREGDGVLTKIICDPQFLPKMREIMAVEAASDEHWTETY